MECRLCLWALGLPSMIDPVSCILVSGSRPIPPPWASLSSLGLPRPPAPPPPGPARLYPNARGCGYPPHLQCQGSYSVVRAFDQRCNSPVFNPIPSILRNSENLRAAHEAVIIAHTYMYITAIMLYIWKKKKFSHLHWYAYLMPHFWNYIGTNWQKSRFFPHSMWYLMGFQALHTFIVVDRFFYWLMAKHKSADIHSFAIISANFRKNSKRPGGHWFKKKLKSKISCQTPLMVNISVDLKIDT